MIKITLVIDPYSKPRGHLESGRIVHNTPEYKAWRQKFYQKLMEIYPKKFGKFFCLYYQFKVRSNKLGRRQDLDNMVGGVNDTLTKHWIPDDNWGVLSRIWVEVDTSHKDPVSLLTIWICRSPIEFLEVFIKHYLLNNLKEILLVCKKFISE